MDSHTILLILFSYFLAAFLKGITGLGFSTICLAVLSQFLDPLICIPLVILPSISSNVIVMVQVKNFFEAIKRFWPLYLCTIPGLFFGFYLLQIVDASISKMVLGITLVTYSLWALLKKDKTEKKLLHKWLALPVGLITGMVNGLTGSQIMPILPYMLTLRLKRELFVQAVNISFTLSSILMLISFNRLQLVDSKTMSLSAIGIIVVAFGVYLSGKVRKRISEERYKQLVLIFLLFLGLGLVVRGL